MIELYTKVGSKIFKRENDFFQFPGGEWHLKDNGNTYVGDEAAVVTGTDPNDYVKLMLWQNACKNYPRIVIPYLPAARADKGSPRGADVYANLIPEYQKLVVFDAHSKYMVDHLKATRGDNVLNVPASEALPKNEYGDISFDGVIAPDEGAVERASDVASRWSVPLYQATKKRDFNTGKLLEFNPPENLPKMGKFLVVDDICDGGGTFIGLARAIKGGDWTNSSRRLYLYVSHGIFSRGLGELRIYYDKILTTDSLPSDLNLMRRPIVTHLLKRAYQ